MTNDFEKVFDTAAEPQDYTGEDGLLYCGSCRTPKEAYFPADKAALFGRDRHPAECDCQRAKRLEREAAEQRRKHLDTVEDLKRRGFTDSKMREWTFANDNGKCPQMGMAHSYVERWEQMKEGNHGLLLWGKVGTGKSHRLPAVPAPPNADQVHFSDIIIDISYDATEDATTFYFTEDTYEENIGWKFAGNLLDQYSAGDVLNLTFDVLNVGNYQGITFESLDYFEAAYAHNNGAAYPNIQDYQ